MSFNDRLYAARCFVGSIVCLARTVFYTALYTAWPFSEHVCGCSFVEQDDRSLRCKICGKVSE